MTTLPGLAQLCKLKNRIQFSKMTSQLQGNLHLILETTLLQIKEEEEIIIFNQVVEVNREEIA